MSKKVNLRTDMSTVDENQTNLAAPKEPTNQQKSQKQVPQQIKKQIPETAKTTNVDVNTYLAHPPMQNVVAPSFNVHAPPAPPPTSLSHTVLYEKPKYNPHDLKLQRKKLKKPEDILKLVDVERHDVFDKYKNYNYMPLVDSREYLRTLRAEIHSISFDGVEQLTDAFLFTLYHCKLNLNSLSWMSLTGCYNITDEGIFWVSKAFPHLRCIQLSGCRKITEKSIHYLNNANMHKMVLDGTNCGVIPENVCISIGADDNIRQLPGATNNIVVVNGCPLISPMISEVESETWTSSSFQSKYRKLVILILDNLPWNPLAFLTNELDISAKPGFIFKQDWLPFADHNFAGINSSAEVFNVFQISRQKGIFELILSHGCIVLLPYHLHKDAHKNMTAITADLAAAICTVQSKYDDCTYILFGMSDDRDPTDYTQTAADIYSAVQTKLSALHTRLNSSIDIGIQYNWRISALNYHEQMALSNGQKKIRQSSSLFRNLKIKDQTLTMISNSVKVGHTKQITGNAIRVLVDAVEIDELHFPWNRQPLQSEMALKYSKDIKMSSSQLTSTLDILKTRKMDALSARSASVQMSKLMSYAELWGHALYYPLLETKAAVTDFNFLADVIKRLFYTEAPRTCDLCCLGNNIPCWTQNDMLTVWPKASTDQINLLLQLLEQTGCFLRFATDPWSSIQDVSYVYVLYQHFPDTPPVRLEMYCPNQDGDIIKKEKFYFCCLGLPDSFFPNLLRQMFKLGGPTLVWKNGAVIEKGYLTVLVEKIIDYQGIPVVVIEIKCQQKTVAVENTVWATLKVYTSVMDHHVLKYGIAAAKCVPCHKCTVTENRYQLLADKCTKRFCFEHLVRSGDNRDMKCNNCLESSIAQFQIGPNIDTSEIIPNHDKLGKAMPTSNVLNRCLMCEHCAAQGMNCPENLKYGQRNWTCECNREGKLCDYCGMCQQCFLHLKSLASVLEPKFESPKAARYQQDQVAAFDEVKVTKKGSILGFIAVDTELMLENSVMTPNYCPDLALTVVKRGYFNLNLEIKHPQEQIIRYESDKGRVLVDAKEVVSKNEAYICDYGETICIQVRYIKTDFTDMSLSLMVNDRVIYYTELGAQPVVVSINNGQSEGVFLQIETPNKFRPSPSNTDKDGKNCGAMISKLTCALEMQMWQTLANLEQLCFGGRGISLSGSACIGLPKEITMDVLKYPSMNMFEDINIHHLCLTWNPVQGKRAVIYSGRPNQNTKDESVRYIDRMSYETWCTMKLIHILDAPGIPATEVGISADSMSYNLWMWHFIMTTYPEMLLPKTTSKLFCEGFVNSKNLLQIKAGLRNLIRKGQWKYFSRNSTDSIYKMIIAPQPGKTREGFLTTKNKVIEDALILQEMCQKHVGKTGLNKVVSKFNKNLELYLCPGHASCLRFKENLPDVLPELYGEYSIFISFINISFNEIVSIPEEFFTVLPNLVDLKIAHNFIEVIPGSIKHCKKLNTLLVHENNLKDLPAELLLLTSLNTLEIGNNQFSKLPSLITKMTSLTKLTFPYNMLTELPEDIGNLVNLKVIHAQGNCFSKLPKSFTKLTKLVELILSGKQWLKLSTVNENMGGVVNFKEFHNFIKKNWERWLEAADENQRDLFQTFDENSNGVLELKEVGKMNAVIFNMFPRFGYKGQDPPDDTTPHGFPEEILSCTKLKILMLNSHGFTKIPPEICQLTKLVELNVSHNPNLLSIPAEISQIRSLKKLNLEDCPLLKTPPREIRDKGFQSTFAYLQRLMSGAVLSKRTKLMLVGLGGAGKTSLVKALLSQTEKADLQQGEAITDGIDIHTWQVEHDNNEITYNIWDFAGQTVYYNTHQFFLSANRAIYLLLWNVRLGHEHAGLDFWLSSVSVQAPKAPIFVIGSHIDQVSKIELPIEDMQQRYPQVVGFHMVSSFSGQGISELKKQLFEVTLQQQYMGEHIPAVWFTFEKNINLLKPKNDIIDYTVVEDIANRSGIFEPSEVLQAVQFLHDLGSIQHFPNEYLKTKVVVNPQWIVDVMACIVTVTNDVIKDGQLSHDDLGKIWASYPKALHSWLLRLTEEFDLTFQLNNATINLVPCLLPERKPKFEWPIVEKNSEIRENKMIYNFDYLPVGLFNRAQVRLHHLSDSGHIWKKGSFLKKNVHIALVQQTRDSQLLIAAQGPRPENILFLIHEVFEGLIAESFHGVTYDFTMPCPECQRMMAKDAHMFAGSTIRRALDMKAPFLQCMKYFHTISSANLQTLLPPDSHGDFDAHLIQCIHGLKSLHKDLAPDIFISYCEMDNCANYSYIQPSQVYTDLVNLGFKCWYKKQTDNQSTDEMAKSLIDSSVFLAFVSVNYSNNEECVNILKYARLTLRKVIVVVAIGDGFEWKQSKIGILLCDKVFVNMTKDKLGFYDSKFEELLKSLRSKTQNHLDMAPTPAVFFSYTWVNSAQAVALGTKEVPGALGYGDPRQLKTYLEKHGVNCWIDVERVGMNGLFDDIAEGLLNAKVVIVCVSDEYANSPTCQIEFRYAANMLKLPIIIVVLGTRDNWRATEVGLMSVSYPIVNMQEKTMNCRKKLLKLVEEKLTAQRDVVDTKDSKNKKNETLRNLSYQELLELAQRKLLRQLTMYAENHDFHIYPRLFVVDFIMEQAENIDELKSEEKESEVSDSPTQKKVVSKRATSTILPAYRLQKFCVYTLCEYDEGWHSDCEPISLPDNFGIESLETFCPFISRITAVMKYSQKVPLKCQTDDVGEEYIKWLEKSPESSMSDYQIVYHQFRELVHSLDTNLTMGNLSRCHLTNGKTIWLCQKHRDSMGVTCLSNEETSSSLTKDQDDKVTNWMLSALRSMDYAAFSGMFKSVANAPRRPEVVYATQRKALKVKEDQNIKENHPHQKKGKNINTQEKFKEMGSDIRISKQFSEDNPTVTKDASKQEQLDNSDLSMSLPLTRQDSESSFKLFSGQKRDRQRLHEPSQQKVQNNKQTSRTCEIS